MERGDMRPIIYENFKDLKARRAEQEAYRKALDEQIMQKKLMQQKERERFEGRKPGLNDTLSRNDVKLQTLKSPERPPIKNSAHAAVHTPNFSVNASVALPPTNLGVSNTPLRPKSSSGGPRRINDIDNFNEPHPAAFVANMERFYDSPSNDSQFQYAIPKNGPMYYSSQQANLSIFNKPDGRPSQAPALWLPPPQLPPETKINDSSQVNRQSDAAPLPQPIQHRQNETVGLNQTILPEESFFSRPRSVRNSPAPPPVPDIPPECMKYIQQVLPGFSVPTPQPQNEAVSKNSEKAQNTCKTEGQHDDSSKNQAFSSCTSSESSSTENVLIEASKKVHVSQTSEQLAGVRVTRKQYKSELQKQIDERKRREEELRRKDQEEEERIQRKIRIDQEKMQREYEEDLKKQKEKELEEERKRQATVSKRSEFIKAEEELKLEARKKVLTKQPSVQRDTNNNRDDGITADQTNSAESLESIGDFFDTTMKLNDSHINPDDRIIPVVAKRLMKEKIEEKDLEDTGTTELNDYTLCSDDNRIARNANSGTPTARIRGGCVMAESFALPEPPLPRIQREMAIRSAPCPSPGEDYDGTGLEFLTSLKNYLKNEKSELDQRVQAKCSRSTERF